MRLVERALPTALFLHDGWQIVRETQGTEATGYLTGLALDEVYRRSTPTGSHDVLTDALGSILGLADSSQAITTSYTSQSGSCAGRRSHASRRMSVRQGPLHGDRRA